MSSLRDKLSFLATKETKIRDLNVGISRMGMEEGITKFSMEDFAFFIVPLVHGTRARFRGGRGGTSGVGVELSATSQIVDERHWYLAKAESSDEKWASEGRIWRRANKKMSGSPSSKRKVVRGGEGGLCGEGWVGRGGSNLRESERSTWLARGMGYIERL